EILPNVPVGFSSGSPATRFSICMAGPPECSPGHKLAAKQRSYKEKYAEVMHKRQVNMYERAWDEAIRREKEMCSKAAKEAQEAKEAKDAKDVKEPKELQANAGEWSGGAFHTFMVPYSTSFGQDLFLVGSCEELGCWDVIRKVPMGWTEGNVWTAKVSIPKERGAVEYKYIVAQGDRVTWESGTNHVLEACEVGQRRDRWQG
ncbi:unnamed protein product, partial [Effrenium voratum]